MHEYRRFVQREMDKRGWNPNQTAQYAGLNRQTVYDIVQDTRDVLPRVPSEKTISGLAKAFGVGREVILAHVAQAMGLPTTVTRADAAELSDTDLLAEVRKRMGARHDREAESQQGPEAQGQEHARTDRPEDGSTPRRGGPIDLAQARRVKDDPAAFGDQPRRGDLDQGQLQPPPPAHKSAAYEPRDGSEGIRGAQESSDRGEESQDDGR